MTQNSGGTFPLGTLGKGTRAEIAALDESGIETTLPEGELERRLIEMGFVEGARVEILHEGFPKRDPIAVRVNDHTVALRRAEADAILVKRLPGKDG
ncbi:MAG TPA: FeoA family protein [Magnetospirillum sp.]|jgi:ferrous iron transport protein A|nr:FeoA family protein [Magnetospirillum sp.]